MHAHTCISTIDRHCSIWLYLDTISQMEKQIYGVGWNQFGNLFADWMFYKHLLLRRGWCTSVVGSMLFNSRKIWSLFSFNTKISINKFASFRIIKKIVIQITKKGKETFFLRKTNLLFNMFGRIVKFVTAERENYRPHFCGSGEPATQDYQPGTLAPNEPIVLIQATSLDRQCTPWSITSRTLSPMCSIFPILNANIIQTSWQ